MPILQKDLIVEKFKAIGKKDPLYLFRGIKIILTPVRKQIDIYCMNLEEYQHKLLDLKSGKFRTKSGEELRLEILSKNSRGQFDQYRQFRNEFGFKLRDLETLLKNGAIIFLLLKNGRIAGVTSLSVTQEVIDSNFQLELMLDKSWVYFFDLYVPVEFRSQGIGYLLKEIAASFALQQGYKYFFSAIYPHNKYSIDMTHRLGTRKIAAITAIDQFFMRRYRINKEKTGESIVLKFRFPNQKVIEV